MPHALLRARLILAGSASLLLWLPGWAADPDTGARPSPEAKWIWAARTADRQTVYFRGTFELRSPPTKAVLYVTTDDSFSAYVNGRPVGESKPDPGDDRAWRHVRALTLHPRLLPGLNAVAIRATNVSGTAGLIARVELDGKPALLTDGSWKVTEDASLPETWTGQAFNAGAWKTATVLAPLTGGPWKGDLEGWPGYQKSVPPGK